MGALRPHTTGLGADFWYFRLGQLVSLLGDSCGHIALAWWILDKTGSAAQMSLVIAPAMIVRIVLLPLFGPIGDKFSRKKIIIFADLWRLVFGVTLSILVYADIYHPVALTLLFCMMSIGTALFLAASGPIVPQIVSRDQMHAAMRQSQSINSLAGVVGGILGGVMVSAIGVLGAFVFDALSYLIATLCTAKIQADTRPVQQESPSKNSFRQWVGDLQDGFRVLGKIPLLVGLMLVSMVINFSLAPLAVVLPVLAKESRGMPPWFLGGLESSISLGAIFGAIVISYMLRKTHAHSLMIVAIIMIGLGVAVMPWTPNALLPMSILFWIGVGSSWASIPLGTQMSLAIPAHYQARLGTLRQFMSTGMAPLGVAGAGGLIGAIGLDYTLIAMGCSVMILAPLLRWVPHLRDFMGVSPQESQEFFRQRFPGVFSSTGGASGLRDDA